MTVERVDPSMDQNNITVRMSELINGMFPEICERIGKYLEILSVDSVIEEQYLPEFSTMKIQKQYRELTDVFIKKKDLPNSELGKTVSTL